MLAVVEWPQSDDVSERVRAGETNIGWVHVVVRRPDGLLVDIQGAHQPDDLLDYWADYLDEPDAADLLEVTRDRFTALLAEDPSVVDNETRTIAARTAARHTSPGLTVSELDAPALHHKRVTSTQGLPIRPPHLPSSPMGNPSGPTI